ncbi:hypothetical protein MYAM1_002284 [Malassezia yamatoensis]|uniref:Fungal lipase-type domain-containing protein n=1 Tax=Malassezia yamatoensis TaxID=253288 RepID=A0AAJ6CH52_9BASI|nr:hypothetical protein MYAM1_002284 [Malassezia yamatoensis]
MFRLPNLLLALALALSIACVNAHSIFPKSSSAKPYDAPTSMPMVSQAAGLTQQTYCPSSKTHIGMKIGDAKLLWELGDGYFVQRALVYHSKSLGIAVAFQGTNTDSLISDLRDVNFPLVPLDSRYSSLAPAGTRVHFGFQESYLELADKTIAAIKRYMKEYNEDRVTIIGHSLGAALGLTAALDVEKRVPKGVHRIILFGLPRLGNPIFADFIDEHFGNRLHWTVNGRDWVPFVPPREFGYQHPSKYVWLRPANQTHGEYFPGQENIHGFDNSVPEWLNFDDHQGIYYHTQIGANKGHCPATVGQD